MDSYEHIINLKKILVNELFEVKGEGKISPTKIFCLANSMYCTWEKGANSVRGQISGYTRGLKPRMNFTIIGACVKIKKILRNNLSFFSVSFNFSIFNSPKEVAAE